MEGPARACMQTTGLLEGNIHHQDERRVLVTNKGSLAVNDAHATADRGSVGLRGIVQYDAVDAGCRYLFPFVKYWLPDIV